MVSMRGGERVLEALCRMFPDADIYTHVVNPAGISKTIARHNITTSFISRLPMARHLYKKYLPLMPYALEALDLSGYDLILSSEAGPAKGIIPPPDAAHICYCHSPMRYIWDQYHVYAKGTDPITKALMLPISHKMRIWDESSAARVDHFIANSQHVQKRIRKYYRRDANIVFPPVAVDAFAPVTSQEFGDYYLWVGELVHYKRPDIAIEAFTRSRKKLLVIGEGPERKTLQRVSGDNITFLGKASFSTLKYHYARCRALIFPGEEDFGIVPVEVQASGRPVIAYKRGGILDTVRDNETGIFFDQCNADALILAVERFEEERLGDYCRDACLKQSQKFSHRQFERGITSALDKISLPMHRV